ncbi:BnaC03g76450D [Brassica napus]|uniref:BnaC03g76450D protein n=1 Tax=Brassica napus TaxID=3708 RepID=A0A078JBK0_BRANA|nr:BnaC03g76450D [Brassica napus]
MANSSILFQNRSQPYVFQQWSCFVADKEEKKEGAEGEYCKKSLHIRLGCRSSHQVFLNNDLLLERFSKQTIDFWILAEGEDSVAEAESSVLESLSSHVRTVVSTLGGKHGAVGRADKWRHLYSGFTVWVSQTEATDEESAKEEGDWLFKRRCGGEAPSALKQLIILDKGLPGKKSPYIRLGCRCDWPNINPPGWDPSSDTGAHPSFSYVFLKQCSFVLSSIKPSNKRCKELSLSCH